MKNNFTIPESSKTLSAQLDCLKQGRIHAILVTYGARLLDEIPTSFKVYKSVLGYFVYNPAQITEEEIKNKIHDDTYYEILGHTEPKSNKTNIIIVALGKEGHELKSSMVSAANLQQQYRSLQKQFPEAIIEIGGNAKVHEILRKRINAFTR